MWNAQLVAATYNGVYQWNGAAWQVLGTVQPANPLSGQSVNSLCVHAGRLCVGGFFASVAYVPATSLASFDGLAWSPVGSGVSGTVMAMTSFSGLLFVGGLLTPIGGTGTNLAA